MHWLSHILGLDDPSGRWYLWWSGFGPDVPIVVGAVVFLRRHNCHVARCPRLGRFHVEGTAWTVCKRHHPTGAPPASALPTEGSPR